MVRRWIVAGAAVVVVAALVWWRYDGGPPPAPIADAAMRTAPVTARVEPPSQPVPAPPPAPDPESGPPLPPELDGLREKIPDNRYWELHAPTTDVEVAGRRADRARELNVLYGKVLSGTGSDDDIRRYFAERQGEHEDAIEIAELVLETHGEHMTDRDRGLWELTIQLHRARLEEIPRRTEEAFARKREQDRRREEWRRAGKP